MPLTRRFWLSQVLVLPLVSVSVLPSASLVTAEALPPLVAVDVRRLLVWISHRATHNLYFQTK